MKIIQKIANKKSLLMKQVNFIFLKEEIKMEEKEIIDVEFTEDESSIKEEGGFIKKTKKKVGDWTKDHRKELLIYVPLCVNLAVEIGKIFAKRSNINAEKDLKDLYIYDPKFRHYNSLCRKPTASELRMIDHRVDDGEIMSDVLEDMGLTE